MFIVYLLMLFGVLICTTLFSSLLGRGPKNILRKAVNSHGVEEDELFLRRVICRNDDSEMSLVCCTGPTSNEDWVVLKGTCSEQCYSPDCRQRCVSALKSLSTQKPGNSSIDIEIDTEMYDDKFLETYFMPSVKNEWNEAESVSTSSQKPHLKLTSTVKSGRNLLYRVDKVEVPNLVLQFLELCNLLKNVDFLNCERLRDMCKPSVVAVDDILKVLGVLRRSKAKEKQLKKIVSNAVKLLSILPEEKYLKTTECCGCTLCVDEPTSEETMQFEDEEEVVNDSTFGESMTDSNLINSALKKELDQNPFPCHCSTQSGETTEDDIFEDETQFDSNIVDQLTRGRLKLSLRKGTVHNQFPCHCSTQADEIKEQTDRRVSTKCTRRPPTKNYHRTVRPGFRNLTADQQEPSCCCSCPPRRLEALLKKLFPRKKSRNLITAAKSGEDIHSLNSYNPEDSVEDYIAYLNRKYRDMSVKYKLTEWNYETNITHINRQDAMISSLEMTQFQRKMNNALEPFKKTTITDSVLMRQIKLLYLPGMSILPDIKVAEFEQVLFGMQMFYSTATVGEWEHQKNRINLNPVISRAMSSSRDAEELAYYWVEWRRATGKKIRPLFEHYVRLMDLTAKANGFSDAGEMWTRRYETEDFMESLAGHWEDVLPLYRQLHAYVRHRLHELYGSLVGANDGGLIPVQLTGDIWGQNWKNLYSIVSPFTDVEDYMKINLYRKKLTPRMMAEIAERTFHSLGFTKFPQEFWRNSIFTKSNLTLMSCEPSAWDMATGLDYRIKICATPTMESFFEIHRLMALAEYYKQYSLQPFVFREAANPGFYEGLAGAVVLSVQSRKHLTTVGLVRSLATKEAALNHLMRMALEKVAFLPYSYILDLWRYKVFKGDIPPSEYNSKWWELRALYQGVRPPVERDEGDLDIGSKLHIAASKPYIKYFVSTIMEFQFHEALCKKASINDSLHDCDIARNPIAGHALRKVMGMGASEHWKKALSSLTGRRKLTSRPLLRYFDPLYQWLQQKNKEQGVRVGWEV